MQRCILAVLLLVASSQLALSLKFLQKQKDSPITQVVSLLTELKASIESDGQAEQASYDKYACWCEDTLATKASDITAGKQQIEELEATIIKLKAEIAAHEAEIKQAEKDIAANIESEREATEVRDKQSVTYEEEKTESEQCVGALEAAINVLSGPGSKKGFLETLKEAQLLSVVAGVRGLLLRPVVSKSMKREDLQVVRHFVEKPEDFVGGRTGALSTAQIANNPFGDYAPQSTQIQGILKGMYDSFAGDMEKSNAEEADKQKGFEELMATKKAELVTLQETLQQHTTDHAAKIKGLADSKASLDDTKVQLEADEVFFAETKVTCRTRAGEWAQRTRLRTEEIAGIGQAIGILSNPDAVKIFNNATNSSASFMQLDSRVRNAGVLQREIAYEHLSGVATKTQSLRLAKIAVALKSGGHFDKIINMIDNMITMCRDEEQQDIKERSWCEQKQYKNKIDMEDLDHAIGKANGTIERLAAESTALDAKITELEAAINSTNTALSDLKAMRIKEHGDFMQGVKDDSDATELLAQAITHLAKFYKDNSIALELVQGVKKDNPPTLGWEKEGGNYGGRKGEHEGIIAILSMIKEDLEKEIVTSRVEEEGAQEAYEKDTAALRDTLRAQTKSQTETEMQKAEVEAKITDLEEFVGLKDKDLSGEQEQGAVLGTNCQWVQTNFDSRRDQRKAEIAGLIDAKNYLAGVDSGIMLG